MNGFCLSKFREKLQRSIYVVQIMAYAKDQYGCFKIASLSVRSLFENRSSDRAQYVIYLTDFPLWNFFHPSF